VTLDSWHSSTVYVHDNPRSTVDFHLCAGYITMTMTRTSVDGARETITLYLNDNEAKLISKHLKAALKNLKAV
jgi:hypothetical protein